MEVVVVILLIIRKCGCFLFSFHFVLRYDLIPFVAQTVRIGCYPCLIYGWVMELSKMLPLLYLILEI